MIKKILQLLTNDWNKAIKDMEAIQRVRELHKPIPSFKGKNLETIMGCLECEETGSGREYLVEYPCPTIQALNGEQA
jgi:hypothetical protein